MKRYEIVTTELGSCLGISVGTAYSLESQEGSFDHIKFYNVLYLPRKQEFTYNYNVHLSKGLVNYYESLNLWHLDSSRYATRQDLFSELQSLGLRPWEEYSSMINDYVDKKAQSEMAKQRILRYQQNLTYNMKKNESNQS